MCVYIVDLMKNITVYRVVDVVGLNISLGEDMFNLDGEGVTTLGLYGEYGSG